MADTEVAIPSTKGSQFDKLMRNPLVKTSKLPPEMQQEVLEICTSSVEKHSADIERCCQVRGVLLKNTRCWVGEPAVPKSEGNPPQVCDLQIIKEALEKKFGPHWNVVIGRSFGYELCHQAQDLLLLYIGTASLGVLCWRA